ncbi:MAG: amino acid adenylation domain-containing protein, partial [Ruminiclostridium sp.]|nr:amino acid adenylation domain-containing protein [Ruminiclostridium sp.]
PMTPNGKIDRKALPEPSIGGRSAYVEPATEKERIVAEIMGTILGVGEPVSAEDSFFELGGDSIKAIRMVSLLREKSVQVSVAGIMKNKTVRGIAADAVIETAAVISQEPLDGYIKDTAIIAYFNDLGLPEPWHYNQAQLYSLAGRAELRTLQKAWDSLTYQHDMLRAVVLDGRIFVRSANTEIAAEEYSAADRSEITAICSKIQSHIDMREALVRAALIHGEDTDYLFIAAHHLIIDGVSWRIIRSDLEVAYSQAVSGTEIKLPAKTNTYKDFAELQHRYRDSYILAHEIPYWTAIQKKVEALSCSAAKAHSRRFEHITVSLNEQDTGRFIHANFSIINADINDALLTAVGTGYRALTGESSVSVHLEGHGREDMGEHLITDRTVGWFTSMYPVILEGLNGDVRHDLLAVKETLHRVPNKGVGYNVLRYLEGKENIPVQNDRMEKILFNYLGDLSGENPDDSSFFRNSNIYTGESVSAKNNGDPDLTINCIVINGSFELRLDYNADVFGSDDARKFADTILSEMKLISGYLSECDTPAVTASDLGETEWTEEEFDKIANEFAARSERLERIYPLLPMQEGMLLKAVTEPDSFAYRIADIYKVNAEFTEEQLIRVLERLGRKHEVLRTAIIYRGVGQPRQAIVDRKLGLTMLDISDSDAPENELALIRRSILKNGFDLQEKPLFGLTSVKISPERSYLIVSVHHAVIDGWCSALYMGDLDRYLREALSGVETKDESPVSGRYEKAVREILDKDKNAGLKYWHELLSDYETQARIPSYGIVPMSERSNQDTIATYIDEETTSRFTDICREADATVSNGTELVWGLVNAVCSRTEDVVFAKVVSGRDNTANSVDDVVGLFINSIPVRIKFNKNTTVRQALSQLQKQSAASNNFDYCALEQIQKQTSLGSDLFQSVFAFENYNSGKEESVTGNLLCPVDIREEVFDDISPVAMIDNGRLLFAVSFNTERYHKSEINRIIGMISTLVKEITEHPDKPLSELEPLDSKDKADVLELSTGETLDYDKRGTWVDLFKSQAEKTPERNAVTDSEGSFTYREIDRISDSIAAYLLDNGVKPNTFVAIKMERSKLFTAAVLGIHKAGAAYLPIDADYPEERIAYMLEDSEASIILTEDAVGKAISKYENAKPVNLAETNNLAYMIYTSGSTGKPKGVMIPHRAMLNFVHFIRYRWKLNENSRIACHSNFSFDASVEDLYPALTVGGCVFIVPEKERHDVFEMRKYISSNYINGGSYSTQFGQLLASDEMLDVDYLCVGGEAMTVTPNARGPVYNAYGPTEFTVDATFFELDKSRKYDNIPIGTPLANCYAFIVGLHGELLPRGIAGELCLAGPQIAEGYWKREELTTEKFVNCPYLDGQKMYRTGDLARYNEAGQIEYLGRIDTQVKLRGFRIELGEIESRASQFEGIKAVAAEVRKDNLVLYYTSENEIDNNKLKSFLSESLTEYMIPSVYMRLPEMPMTPNGKIDRKALPEPDLSSLKAEYEAPRNETEKKLCDAFAEVLGIDKDSVGINDDFIMLGGSSIKSMRLTVIAGIDGLVVNDIYRLKTPKNIAKELLGRGAADYALDEAEARKKAVPATIGQISMVDYQFANLNSVMYNMPELYEIDSSIDEQRLTEAVNAVIENHPALSTQFEMGNDGVIIQRYKPGSISVVSIETIHDNDIQSVIDELVQPFRIFNSPLFRARIFRCGEKLYLFMDMHHAISDGASMDILFYNIYSAYQGEPLKPDNYYSFVLNESRMSETDIFREAQEHFRSILGDTKWCCIPVPDHESWETEPAEQTVLTGLTADDIKSAESRLGVSGNVMCITAGILALTRYCDNSDIHVNWDYSNRSDARYQNTVGRLFKILPVAVHTRDYGKLSDLINEVNRQVSEGIANSVCNYAELTEATLSDAMEINYLFDFDDKMFLETTGFRSVDADFEFSAVGEHIAVYIFEHDGEMAALADYQAKAYEEGSIARFLQMFREYLRKIVLEGTENIEQAGNIT